MDFTPETLTAVALGLPAPDRARIAEALLDSLDTLDAADAGHDAELLAEAERRDRALAADPGSGRPASAVFAGARARLATGEFADAAARGA